MSTRRRSTRRRATRELAPNEYEVEDIVSSRIGPDGEPEYLIKWRGYKEQTWEKEPNLEGAKELLNEFKKKSIAENVVQDVKRKARRKSVRQKLVEETAKVYKRRRRYAIVEPKKGEKKEEKTTETGK